MKKALVVLGATGAIGRNITNYCEKENLYNKYFLYGRDETKLELLKEINPKAIDTFIFDMEEKPLSMEIASEAFCFNQIDIVLLSFTIEPIERIGSMNMETVRKNINVNILSQINFIENFVRGAQAAKSVIKLIFIDSGAAYRPINGLSLYCSSKAYMDMYLQCVAKENSFQLVLFEPGVIDTGMQEKIRQSDPKVFDQVEEFINYKETGKFHSPEDVASQIVNRYLKKWTATDMKERFNV